MARGRCHGRRRHRCRCTRTPGSPHRCRRSRRCGGISSRRRCTRSFRGTSSVRGRNDAGGPGSTTREARIVFRTGGGSCRTENPGEAARGTQDDKRRTLFGAYMLSAGMRGCGSMAINLPPHSKQR
ncbi:hypothetical protein JB92DRAFT_749081 [Gautieria morchelliformis]|nr:hypothetical protein JB92DRAFT_749081 [Gautieria morchelliformis]